MTVVTNMTIEVDIRPAAPPIRCLWVHNFDPGVPVSGVFMHLLADAVQELGVSVEMLYTGSLASPLEVWRARNHLRWLRPQFDIVHAQYGSMCAWVGASVAGPRILSVRGSDWHPTDIGPWEERAHGRLATWLTRMSLPQYERVFTMSDRMSREIQAFCQKRGMQGTHVSTLTDGLSLKDFRPLPRALCRAALSQAGNENPWVLMTTLDEKNPIKRVSLAKAAVAHAKKSVPNIELKIASGVRHSDMPTWVNACNLTLMTSVHEGWPNAIKESLACGVPFVTTDISDLSALVQPDNACHVVADDPIELGNAIVAALHTAAHSDVVQFGEALRGLVQHMDLPRVARAMVDTYADLMNSTRSAQAAVGRA